MALRRSTRRRSYDYKRPGIYFITFNTKGRRELLSHLQDDKLYLSALGQRCEGLLSELPDCFEGLIVDTSVIMPDHIHLLLDISPRCDKGMSDFLRWFKGSAAKAFHDDGGLGALWQRGGWDVIVHDNEALVRIRRYILQNPARLAQARRCGDVMDRGAG